MSDSPSTGSPSTAAKVVGVLGILAHAALSPFFLSSGLLAPLWAVIVLVIVWAALLVLAVWLWRFRPFLVPLVPVAAVEFWFAVMTAGESLLGWTP